MTTIAAGQSGSYTFTELSNVTVSLDSGEHALVVVLSSAGDHLFSDRASSTKTIGPFPTGAVLTVTADGAAVDYAVSTAKADGNFASYTGKEAVSYATDPITGLDVLDAGSLIPVAGAVAKLINDKRTFVLGPGDSRQAVIGGSGPLSTTAAHWFAWASALNGANMRHVANYGISGKRSDEYLATNFAASLTAPGYWYVFNSPAINDIAQAPAPYTTLDGVAITLTNVAEYVAGRILTAAITARAAGYQVVITSEPGSNTCTQAQCTAVYELNQRLKEICQTYGFLYFDIASVLWNPGASATTISFKTGYTLEGTHLTHLGAYYAGKAFAALIGKFIPAAYILPSNKSDVLATNARQLIQNPLFTTLTGGASSGVTLTGNVPANWTLGNTAGAGTSVTITSAANADGYGNDVTLTITAGAADTVTFQQAGISGAGNANWLITDIMQSGVQMDVAAGSSNFVSYWQQGIATVEGPTQNNFVLYSGVASGLGPGPAEAYTLTYAAKPAAAPLTAGGALGTRSFIAPYLKLVFTAAGSATITLRRPFWDKRFAL